VSASSARRLVEHAAAERTRLRRHLLVAAALREVLERVPIVVGGTAEEYWTADEYHPTDLDLCAPLGHADRGALAALGFRKEGRHWIREGLPVAIEFPDSRIDGDEERTIDVSVPGGAARVIGLDDLYLDRLRQATVNEASAGGTEFQSALAVVAARYEDIDWPYVRSRIVTISMAEGPIGETMRRINSRITRRIRRSLE